MKVTKKLGVLTGKKILLVGLGRLGGGVAAARFFASRGAHVTVTDQLSAHDLAVSIYKLKKYHITYTLGGHEKKDFANKDIIVFNQAVPAKSPWVSYARRHCKEVYNDLTFFLSWMSHHRPNTGYVGITGTRGKTTVTTWIGHLLKPAIIGGNMPQNGLYTIIEKLEKMGGKKNTPIVLELSSFQLEYLSGLVQAPHVAVITNLSQDHLNRHGTMEEYARVKSLIFKNQKASDTLVLNADNVYTKKFLARHSRGNVKLISLKRLLPAFDGLFVQKGMIYSKEKNIVSDIAPMPYVAEHDQRNFLAAIAAAHAYGVPWKVLFHRTRTLPTIPFRQQIVYQDKKVTIINDSAATSPEGAIAALRALAPHAQTLAFICGGTDKQLDMMPLAHQLKKILPIKNLFLLEGSATKKLLVDMKRVGYGKNSKPAVYDNLEDVIFAIKENKKFTHIILSPGAASFEKFKNEFDRGRKFNAFIKAWWR